MAAPSLSSVRIPSPTLDTEDKPHPDENPVSPHDAKTHLEKLLANDRRAEKDELINRNILKDSNAAPSLQAAQADLKKHQLENKIAGAISHRPDPDSLIKEGILHQEDAPPSS